MKKYALSYGAIVLISVLLNVKLPVYDYIYISD